MNRNQTSNAKVGLHACLHSIWSVQIPVSPFSLICWLEKCSWGFKLLVLPFRIGYALGFLNLEDNVATVDGKVSRVQVN